MLRTLGRTLLASSLFAAACQGQGAGSGPEAEYQAAIPAQDSLQISVPGSSSGTTSVGEHKEGLIGGTAGLYVVTRLTSEDINGHVGLILGILWAIVHTPPTSVTANSATWGPGGGEALSPVVYRLVVTRVAPGQYSYHLDARPKDSQNDADFQTILDGAAQPSIPAGRGSGNLTLNLTTAHSLDPVGTPGQGSINVGYDFGANPKSISVHFAGVMDAASAAPTGDYLYERNDDGSGDFSFTAHANLVDTTAALEDGSIRSRWEANGAGRSDARVTGGDATTGVTVSECWDTNFREVYLNAAGPNNTTTQGDAAACVFQDQLLP
jgi:hypothetical protein